VSPSMITIMIIIKKKKTF